MQAMETNDQLHEWARREVACLISRLVKLLLAGVKL